MALDLIKYLRICYKHLGRGWVQGDCFNLGLLFYKEQFNLDFPDFTNYTEDWANEGKDYFLKMYKAYGFKLIKDKEYRYGDVLFLTTKGKVSHIGIVIDVNNGYFIHTTKAGTAVHNYLVGEWSERVFGGVRYKEPLNEN